MIIRHDFAHKAGKKNKKFAYEPHW